MDSLPGDDDDNIVDCFGYSDDNGDVLLLDCKDYSGGPTL